MSQCLAYLLLALWLDNVLPDEHGVCRPPWYFLQPSYWVATKVPVYMFVCVCVCVCVEGVGRGSAQWKLADRLLSACLHACSPKLTAHAPQPLCPALRLPCSAAMCALRVLPSLPPPKWQQACSLTPTWQPRPSACGCGVSGTSSSTAVALQLLALAEGQRRRGQVGAVRNHLQVLRHCQPAHY
jgi:hypothetical protein